MLHRSCLAFPTRQLPILALRLLTLLGVSVNVACQPFLRGWITIPAVCLFGPDSDFCLHHACLALPAHAAFLLLQALFRFLCMPLFPCHPPPLNTTFPILILFFPYGLDFMVVCFALPPRFHACLCLSRGRCWFHTRVVNMDVEHGGRKRTGHIRGRTHVRFGLLGRRERRHLLNGLVC